MQNDKDLGAPEDQGGMSPEQAGEEENLEWLLDMEELSDPEETLFKVEGEDYKDTGLTALEAQMADRPMTRGNESGDDLANYVSEEIVISSEGSSSDIYGDLDGDQNGSGEQASHSMAIDFTARDDVAVVPVTSGVDEGTDILGLASDDDMGEAYLTIKRVKASDSVRDSGVVARASTPQVEQPESVASATIGSETLAGTAVAGSDVAQVSGSVQEETPDLNSMQGAPVPTQVADAQNLEVANEEESELANSYFDIDDGELETESLGLGMEGLDDGTIGLELEDVDLELDILAPGDDEQSVAAESGQSGDVALGFEAVETELDSLDVEFETDIFAGDPAFLEGGLDELEFDVEPLDASGTELEATLEAVELDLDAAELVEAPRMVEEVAAADEANELVSEEGFLGDLVDGLDEDEFDDLLLGANLETKDDESLESDFLQLDVEPEGDALSLDTSSEVDIDYPEDFAQVGGQGGSTDIAALIPAVMTEVSMAAQARMLELGMNADALQVDALLGNDAESVAHGVAEGYQVLSAIYPQTPEALAPLSQLERDVVYARLLYTEDAEQDLNTLFADDFTVTAQDSAAEEVAEAVFAGFDELDADAVGLDPVAHTDIDSEMSLEDAVGADLEGFGDDLFAEGLGDDFTVSADGAPEGLDAAFDAFSAEDDDRAGDVFADDFGALSEEVNEEFGKVDDALDVSVPEMEESLELPEMSTEGLELEPIAKSDAEAVADSFDDALAEAAVADDMAVEEAAVVQPEEAPGTAAVYQFAEDVKDLSWCIPEQIQFNSTSQGSGEIFADFLDAFVEEGSAEIEKLEDLINEWERHISNEDVVAEVGRTLHTVKGIAKGVGLQRYGTLIHNYETLLEKLPAPAEHEQQAFFRIVNVWLDAVVRGIEHVESTRGDIASELPEVALIAAQDEQSEAAANTEVAAPAETAAEAAEKEHLADQQLADEGAKALSAQQSVRITSEKLDHLLNLTNQTQQLSVRASQANNRGKRSTAELQGRLSSVRTHIGKIADRALLSVTARGNASSDMDALEMDQYSELQEAASILREGVEDLADLIDVLGRQNIQVETLLKQQSSIISSISSSIQGVRVVPVSRLMPSLRRIVRTVSTDLGKLVAFRVLNEVGALDRDHHARLQVVLEHMVRNALDHGIEAPDARKTLGKSTKGTITIDVVKSGGDYVITLADDGRGIDPDSIRESAIKKGLDVDIDALSDEQVLRLIFHKGFSTATTVSEISGRGVGMDIVLTELQQLGGDIQIKSALGKGTTFEVRIPSNVTVNGALMVTAGDDSYAIPLNGLIAVEQVPADQFFSAVRGGERLSLYDMDCEPAYLAALCQGVALPERNFWESFVPVIIAGTDERYMAIAIDSVQEALELVVRSLGTQFSNVPGLAGAATTADGEAIVALDLNLLVKSVHDEGVAAMADAKEEESQALVALVVDDSRTQRMVATSQLDTVGVESITAENGQVAIDLLNSTHHLPDVVLLDVEMPVKDGIETLREIRKSQRYGHLPVIMVTSRTGAKHRALAKDAGCNAYMGKPFNFPALVEQINVLTGQNLQLS